MSEFNPYAPPAAPVEQALPLRYATRGQRFATLLLDTFFFLLLAIVIGIGFVLLDLERELDAIPDPLLDVLLMLLYYAPQEAYSGRTLGKWIMKTRVVNEQGGPISTGQVFGRTLCRMIPFEAFSFLSAGEQGPRGWHDSIPKTIVVSTREA